MASGTDKRTRAEKDRDRILYSAEFRRLAGVTQVVAVDETRLFHNRLTHTLKVAQVAERMATHLRDSPEGRALKPAQRPNPGYAAAASMAHDLGHPPFGHIGEKTLNRLCRERGLEGFEGNAQSFRLVNKLAWRNSPTPGLDLHFKTLNGLLKYPWRSTSDRSKEEGKWGVYVSELPVFDAVRNRSRLPDEVRSLEAEIMDWADDITYALHDLEDFLGANKIPALTEQIKPGGSIFALLQDAKPSFEKKGLGFEAAVQALAELVPLMTLDHAAYKLAPPERWMHRTTSIFITRWMNLTKLHSDPPYVRQDDAARAEVEVLKAMTMHYVINNSALATVQEGHIALLTDLFRQLENWLIREEPGTPARLPTKLWLMYVAAWKDDPEGLAALRLQDPSRPLGPRGLAEAVRTRCVCDYIACLTERQAVDLWGRLSGNAHHSIQEDWTDF